LAAGGSDEAGCTIELAREVAGIATYAAECHWPVAPRFVAAIVGDPQRIAAASTALVSSTPLADGRILNVLLAGWPIDDRQSTLAIIRTALADGGLLLSYTLVPVQAPLDKGRVQARRDDGHWEIRGDTGGDTGGGSGGGTRVLYETSYDAGGSLPVSVVQRTVRSSVAESLAEIRAAAELLAGAEAPRAGTDSSERKRAGAGGSE
jgi:hypothetical protein